MNRVVKITSLELSMVEGFIERAKMVPIFNVHYTKLLLDFMDEMSFHRNTAKQLGRCLADAVIKKHSETAKTQSSQPEQLDLYGNKKQSQRFSAE